ncbi:MAG: restriction endonuclease subunit S, partial [Kiritimatiellae bacterium]|nr:restriction endonuclease subunit S [Kiritimatiellia bacterium]
KSRFVEMFGDPEDNPKGFPLLRIDDVVSFHGGSQPDKKFFEYEPTVDNVRLIQIRDYRTDRYKTYIPRSLAKRHCNPDDIMIGRYGPPIFQIFKGLEGAYNVAMMKAVPKMGNREFIRAFLQQDCLRHYLEGFSKRTAGQDGIQMDKLKAYPFPYPPIELQDLFAAFVEKVDKLAFAARRRRDVARQLYRAKIQEFFG